MKLIALIFSLVLSSNAFASIGKITAISGSASIERNQQTFSAKTNSLIEAKDTITTNESTQLQMIFNDKTVITLGENTRFSVESYAFDNTDKSQVNFSLTKGFMKSVTGQIGKLAPNRFKVKTKDATIGIRGTIFTLETNERFILLSTLSGATFFLDKTTGKVYEVPKNKKIFFNLTTKKVEISNLNSSNGSFSERTTEDIYDELQGAEQNNQNNQIDQQIEKDLNDAPGNQQIEVEDLTYSAYGYWLNNASGQMSDVYYEGIGNSETNPDRIFEAINNSLVASYSGNVIAFDDDKSQGTGTINVDVDFSSTSNPITGNLDYTTNGVRWNTDFAGDINSENTGIEITSYSPATSDITSISGNIEGVFYGPNAEELAGKFELNGENSDGVTVGSVGSYSAKGVGITAP